MKIVTMRALPWMLALSLLVVVGARATDAPDVSGAAAPHPAAPAASNPTPASDDEIAALQQRLTANGCYQGPVNGQTSPALENAIKACPSQNPFLRIETGMHVAMINRIGVDKACGIAVTGSDDKTVREWSLPEGRLLRTLRIPIGPGNGGKVYATAISPDGHWIAAGGWDAQWDTSSQNYLYIFDATTGAMVSRIGPSTGTVLDLAFSPDGRWLAATSEGNNGLKVIDTQTWQIVAQDRAYGDAGYSVAFAPDGRLYTVADDNKLRQYSPGPAFRKEREIVTEGDPESVAVDPRGQLIAVGIYSEAKIDFYDAATLTLRFAADVKGIDDADVFSVVWSSDGTRLFAGGRHQAQIDGQWKHLLVTFDRNGQQIGEPVPVSDSTIMNLQHCGNTIAVAAADPAFGLVHDNGQVKPWQTSVAADMRGKHSNGAFTLAANAASVRFGLGYGIEDPVLFDLAHATVTNAPTALPGFLSPTTEGLPVANWEGEFNPTFDGRPIRLDHFERSRSLAIRPDRSGFVLGTEFRVRAFDAHGKPIWERPGPGTAWGVNFSADGRVVVVAYYDGTLRWLRWSDGQELLALFVDRKSRAWVAWTPSGYYMASPGGEDLIGWHVNRGWNQAADFFPASRFRDRFNRSDIVSLILATLDEGEAIKQANDAARRHVDTTPLIAHLPPVVRISSPTDDAHVQNGAVTLQYAVRSPSGQAVDRIDLLIDGRPAKTFGIPVHTGLPNAETTGSIPVTLTEHVTEVGLQAWSNGLASQTVQVKITWDAAPAATRKLFALVIGVSKYADPTMTLKYAAKDANDFASTLVAQKGLYYTDVQTRVLTDDKVTRASVIEGLEWLEKMATGPNDVTVVFLSGHGMTDPHQTYWFYTADSNDDDVRIKGVSQNELSESLQGLHGKVLWFLDTCHAGAAAKRPPVDISVLVNTATASENGGVVVFASSTGKQVSVESADLGNGAFTKAVIEGIAMGKAAPYGDLVTTSSLDGYVRFRVDQITHGAQTPVMERPPQEPDFAIAEIRK
jgi:WD40 repeat protein